MMKELINELTTALFHEDTDSFLDIYDRRCGEGSGFVGNIEEIKELVRQQVGTRRRSGHFLIKHTIHPVYYCDLYISSRWASMHFQFIDRKGFGPMPVRVCIARQLTRIRFS